LAALLLRGSGINSEYLLGAFGIVLLGAYTAVSKYKTTRNAEGEVSFIPYLTAIVVYPHWATVGLIGISVTLAELVKKKHYVKRLFNASQYVLASCSATYVYVTLGGLPLAQSSKFNFLPHTLGVLSFLVVNSVAVAAVIAIAERKNLSRTLFETNRSSFLYDLFAIPGVYCVARAYTDWSWWGLLLTVLLLHGVRVMYQAKQQLETTNRELLELFVQTVDFRDDWTAGHSKRVSRYSQIIARVIGLSQKEIDRVGKAALLHDVGKIHYKFGPILSKPGPLTPDERETMEEHPVMSAGLVSKLTEFENIIPDVRHHHENYDGTGYPDRIAGKQIPLGSRIIMFADTIDAMTSDRPYRKALGPDAVKAEILRCRGQQFDPEICDLLLASPEFYALFNEVETPNPRSLTQILEKVRFSRLPEAVLFSDSVRP